MKRLALLLVLAAAFLHPGQALADAPTFKGKLHGGGKVAFELKRKANGDRRVSHWRWRNFPLICNEKQHEQDGYFNPPDLKVASDRSFTGRFEGQTPTDFAEVNGSFGDWKKATGTFQVSGDTPRWQNCESGVVDWSATRK